MLSAKKEKRKSLEPGTTQNRINEGTEIKGNINSTGHFRIDGRIEGNVKTPTKVVIGKTGIIIGSLISEDADIEGKIEGTIEVSGTLTLRSSAVIDGDVTIGRLAVEPGAILNANCIMQNPASNGQIRTQKRMTNKRTRELTPTESE